MIYYFVVAKRRTKKTMILSTVLIVVGVPAFGFLGLIVLFGHLM
jgi:hypothetical protein